ncbi:MAG: hypothetical protein WCR21_04715 [Bacteroidota bacterium]
MKKHLVTLFLLLVFQLTLSSQVSNDTAAFVPQYRHGVLYTIETSIGTKHTGFIVLETKDYIVIENRNNFEKVEINKSQIIDNKQKKQNTPYTEEIFGDNDHAANYMFSGSAFLFEEGDSYSNTHYLIYQNMDYALTDHWAISVGSLLFYPISIGIKCNFKINDYNYYGFSANAVGNIFAGRSGAQPFWGYNALAKFTHGTSNKNFTISSGILAINALMIDPSSTQFFFNIPFVSGAYCNRFTEKFALNTEVWLFPQTMVALAGAGFKYLHSNRIAWTFGCYTNVISDKNQLKLNTTSIPIPYIAYARKFK